MNAKRPPDPERARRLKVRADYDSKIAALRFGPAFAAAPSDISPAALVALGDAAIGVTPGQALVVDGDVVGTVGRASKRSPLRVRLVAGQPKPCRMEAPTYLEVVRCMPCSVCGKGVPFYVALAAASEAMDLRAGAQSECNHHPGRGSSGGGSDFEVHPVCGPSPFGCHGAITDEKPNEHGHRVTVEERTRYVADTLLAVMVAIRHGRLHPEILLAASVEAVMAKRR